MSPPLDYDEDDDSDYRPSDHEDNEDQEIDYEDIAMDILERDAQHRDDEDEEEEEGEDEDENEEPLFASSSNIGSINVNLPPSFLFSSDTMTTSLSLSDIMLLLNSAASGGRGSHFLRSHAPPPEPLSGAVRPEVKEPQPNGVELLLGGEFGKISRKKQGPPSWKSSQNLARNIKAIQRSWSCPRKEDIASDIVPNSSGSAVAMYGASVYSGQFSPDSSFYYTCCRDFRLHVYDTTVPIKTGTVYKYDEHKTSMKLIKTVRASPDSWTIVDSHLSPDNEKMIWACVTPTVYMTSSTGSDTTQTPIYFGDRTSRRGGGIFGGTGFNDYCSVWSCRFSSDGKEIVAGGDGRIFVYDLVGDRRTVKIEAHEDDVNSCCWADTASGNVLISASDDSFLKVWDRRSLGSHPKPSGVLIGHTEGITYVSPKGDGRYVISNGKDQILRLWDLRKMHSNAVFESVKRTSYGVPNFDYRRQSYPKPRHKAHPKDCSVMQYSGHAVLRTLIRCHFSPAETTGQQYIYSGSQNGKIHIWSLDGQVVEVLDRKKSLPMSFNPSESDPMKDLRDRCDAVCVRDVSWHSREPVLMSAGWDNYHGDSTSSIVRHEWKGLLKRGGRIQRGELEDHVEKRNLEQRERSRRLPGAFQDDESLYSD